jgi:hypothetical protein
VFSRFSTTQLITQVACTQHSQVRTVIKTSQTSFLPILHQQEVLCSWLT